MEQARSGGSALVVPVIVLVIGVVLVLLGQFVLDSLADSSDTWHWVQHGVLFVGGICVGVAGVRLWASGQRS